MAESVRLKQSDVREAIRVIGECRELGDDPLIWRNHCLERIAKLVDADIAGGGETAGCLTGVITTPGMTLWGFDHGFNLEGLQILWEWNATDPNYSELWKKVREELLQTPSGVAVSRHQMLNNDQWYRAPDYQLAMRTLGADATVLSFHQRSKGGDQFEGACFFRAKDRPSFRDDEVALITLIHGEIARLVGGPLASFVEPRPSQLPPRVREALRCLLEGDSDKQIAARLHLSPHTVNQYTKRIFRHFQVSGRVELIARWLRRGWGIASQWAEAGSGVEAWRPTPTNGFD